MIKTINKKINMEKTVSSITSIVIFLFSLSVALLAGIILLRANGINPMKAYLTMFNGAFGNRYAIVETLAVATPITLVALGFSLASQCNTSNIGGEGQMSMGALGATLAAVYLPDNTPVWLAVGCVIFMGFLFGALWILTAALMKAYHNVSEIVVTVMLNNIAAYVISWLVSGVLKDKNSAMYASEKFSKNWSFPILVKGTNFHLGILIALLSVILIWFLMNKTIFGYQLKTIGFSLKAARYAGMPVTLLVVVALLISAGLAGIAGAGQAAGIHNRLISDISAGYGYTAIVVAQLGKDKPFRIAIVSFGYSALTIGANAMERGVGAPAALATIIQVLTVLLWICGEHIIKVYKVNKKRDNFIKKEIADREKCGVSNNG